MKDVPNWTSWSTELVPSPVALLLILPSLSAAVISSGLHPWQPPRPRKNNTQRENKHLIAQSSKQRGEALSLCASSQ